MADHKNLRRKIEKPRCRVQRAMKLKSAIALGACLSAVSVVAGATLPLPGLGHLDQAADGRTPDEGQRAKDVPTRLNVGKTLLLDARVGHEQLGAKGEGETLVYASVSGSEQALKQAPPLHLGIVIDRSGSMKGERIANAIAAAVGTVERMRDIDTVTVVTFDTEARIIVPPTQATAASKPSIEAAVRAIQLGGDTCISCGLELTMRELMDSAPLGDHVTRMLLLSDGKTNNGIRDEGELRQMAARMRRAGCAVSTIGVDLDFDEKVMSAIAEESNGHHYFVASASGLPDVFAKEFDGLLSSVASEAELEIELEQGVELVELFDRSFHRDGKRLRVPLGTFSAKQEKTVLMRVRVPTDRLGKTPVANLKLGYRDLGQRSDGHCAGKLALSVVPGASAELDPFVEARLERSRTARVLIQANELFELGKVDEAQKALEQHRTSLSTRSESAKKRASAKRVSRPLAAPALDRDFDEQMDALASAEDAFEGAEKAAGDRLAGPAGVGRGNLGLNGTGHGGGGKSGVASGGSATVPPPATKPRPKPSDTRQGRQQVRQNQANAFDFGL